MFMEISITAVKNHKMKFAGMGKLLDKLCRIEEEKTADDAERK